MKRLSDYKEEEAIELWMDLLEPIGNILSNKNVKKAYKANGNKLDAVKAIIAECKADAMQILLRIDPTPIDGLNLITRLIDLLMEFEGSEDLKPFFQSAGIATGGASSGNATENTEGVEA